MKLKKREEIIKALECCLADRVICDNRPIQNECESNPFDATLARHALALIKELIEEIKDLEADYERVYEQAEADIHGNIADGGTSCHWCMDKTRGDTVRKMQSKLIDASEFALRADSNGSMYYVDYAAWVEKVTREILEE